MLLWQEIWSISCRVSPSYSISTTANNHQLGSGPDHLSLGNKEGDNSQWEAFYLNSVASRRISSLRLPAPFLDTSRLFRRKDGHCAFLLSGRLCGDIYYLIGLQWPVSQSVSVTDQAFVSRPLCLTFLLSSRQEMWKTYQSHHIISRRQLLSNNWFLRTHFMADKYSLEQKNYFDTCEPKLKSIYLLFFCKNNFNCNLLL